MVAEIRPRFFLAENVLGILDPQNVPLVDLALDHVRREYNILAPVILKASEHGVPTTRTRVFFYGYRQDAMRPLHEDDLSNLRGTEIVHVEEAFLGLPQYIADEWQGNPAGWLEVPALGVRSYYYDRIRGHIPH